MTGSIVRRKCIEIILYRFQLSGTIFRWSMVNGDIELLKGKRYHQFIWPDCIKDPSRLVAAEINGRYIYWLIQ